MKAWSLLFETWFSWLVLKGKASGGGNRIQVLLWHDIGYSHTRHLSTGKLGSEV